MPSSRFIEIDDHGGIIANKPAKAVVRFPTEEEHAAGMDIVPREVRLREYQELTNGN